jgi:LysM domain-containing protein
MHGGAAGGLAANPRRHRRRYASNRRRYSGNPTLGGLIANPTYSNLFENPMGPYSMASLKSFGVAAAGLALGLAVARGADRYVATMKPADSKSGNKANRAWFGRAAAAAINRRPTILRLGVQAGGAVLAIGGAYALRNRALAPWLLGGIALGFGSNLFLQFLEWWVIPYLMKRKDPSEMTLTNRLYSLEQIDDQDKVDAAFLDWQNVPALAAAQDQNAPVITSPLGLPASISVLGRPGSMRAQSMVGAPRRFVADGRVGHCDTCGGDGGHYSGCSQCDICNGGGGRKCAYTVQPGSDIYAVASASGVSVGEIAAMNGGGTPDSFWIVGREVTLPEAACNAVLKSSGGPSSLPLNPMTPPPPATNTLLVNQPPPGINTQVYQATGPNVPTSQIRQAVIAGPPNGSPAESTSALYAITGGGE